MINPDLAHLLVDCATETGTGDGHERQYLLHTEAPRDLLRDLRYAGRTDFVTAWQSPRYRAILLAAEGGGRIVAFADQAHFREAVQLARQGILPEVAQVRER